MQLELYINDQLADLTEESILAVTKTYETIENPLNYYTEFSKTIKLPLSERNNAIFSNFYRQDSIITNVTVDYTKKFDFLLLNDSERIMSGNLQLNNANTIYTDECYEVTLFGTLGLIMNTLGLLTFNPYAEGTDPQYIIENPFSDTIVNRQIVKDSFQQFRHRIDGDDILDWIGFIPTYQGKYPDFSSDKEQILPSGRTEDMTQERDEHYTREFRSYYQQPFVWVDKLWKVAKQKIEEITDYTFNLDKSWFNINNPYYTDLIYTCPSLYNADDNYSAKSITLIPKINQWSTYRYNRTPPIGNHNISQMTNFQVNTVNEMFRNDVFNPDGNMGVTKFHANFNLVLCAPLEDDSISNLYARIRDDNPFLVEIYAVNANTNQAVYGAIQRFVIYSESSDHIDGYHEEKNVDVARRGKPNITLNAGYRPILWTGSSDYGGLHREDDGYFWEANLDVTLNVQENVPYKIYVNCHTYNNDKPFEYAPQKLPRWDYLWTDFFEESWSRDRGYSAYLDLLSGYAETVEHHRSTSDLNLYRVFPKDTTLRDVLLNYSKMCGLVWEVDEEKKEITVMSRNRFFQDYTIKDWSDKVDRSNEFRMQPLTFDHRFVNFNYENGDCTRLKGYEAKYQNTYGAKKLDTGYDFNVEQKDLFKGLVPAVVSTKKQASINANSEYEDSDTFVGYGFKVLPNEQYVDNDDNGNNAGMSGAFYFRNGTVPPDPLISLCDTNGQYCVIVSDDPEYQIRSGNYCWDTCGENWTLCYTIPMVSTVSNWDYLGRHFSVHFEKPAEYYYSVSYDNINYLYNSYWKNYIDERYCSQNKKLTAYFYLTPQEFAEVDFREFIKIDNILYHIDKIYDYNFDISTPVKIDLAQVWNIQNYTNGQSRFAYLYTVPGEVTLSPTNITDYTKVDVYYSMTAWRLASTEDWISVYIDGDDLMIKPNSTTLVTRETTIKFVNILARRVLYELPVKQNPPSECTLDPDRTTLVFNSHSDSAIVKLATNIRDMNAISVTTNKSWIDAYIMEYRSGYVGAYDDLRLVVSVNQSYLGRGRNGQITLSMPCGQSTVQSVIYVGQQSGVDEQREDENDAIATITDQRDVFDENNNKVTSLVSGQTYHFGDIFGEEIDISSIRITNGIVNVSGNAGEQKVTFTPQLANGDTIGGGIIAVDTVNGKTIVYNYNVEALTPAPTDRLVTVTAATGGWFRITVGDSPSKTVEYYSQRLVDGTVVKIMAVPYTGYAFSSWTDSQGMRYNTTVVTFTVDSRLADTYGNITFTPTFKASTELVEITLNSGTGGYLTVGTDSTQYTQVKRTVPVGSVIGNVEAHSNGSAVFNMWSDGSTANPRDFIVNTANTNVTAIWTTSTTVDVTLDGSGLTGANDELVMSVDGDVVLAVQKDVQKVYSFAAGTYQLELKCGIADNNSFFDSFTVDHHVYTDNPHTQSLTIASPGRNFSIGVTTVPTGFYYTQDDSAEYQDELIDSQQQLLKSVFQVTDIQPEIAIEVTPSQRLTVALPTDYKIAAIYDDNGDEISGEFTMNQSANGNWMIWYIEDIAGRTKLVFTLDI